MAKQELQFKAGAEVFSADDEKVGSIRRVVIDPQTREVTHVVVEKGILFTEDKVIPVDWFDITTEDKVILDMKERDVEGLPPFEEVHYIPWREAQAREEYQQGDATEPYAETYAQPYLWYPPAHVNWWSYPGYRTYFGVSEPPYVMVAERTVPVNTTPLKEGANVISSDGEHVGDVERIFADPETARATHFVIAEGLIFKDKKLVPSTWITMIEEDQVHLSVDSDVLDQLDTYEE